MRRAPLLLSLLLIGACKFDEAIIDPGRERIVVHAVLDPGRFDHRILVERLLTGRVGVSDSEPFDSLNPIASHGGSPLSGATVIVYGPAGDSAIAYERTIGIAAVGTGMYEFFNGPPDPTAAAPESYLEILPGATYRLRITTSDGQTLTAVTTVPSSLSAARSLSPESFNRDRESLFYFWEAVPGAARYMIAVTSPEGPFSIFVDSLEFEVSGALKNTADGSLADVFVPGFTQDVTVSAVDRNYFDYYRSQNDDVTGRGLLSSIDGGLGVFGSMLLLRFSRLEVTADSDHPFEGLYGRASGNGPVFLELFVIGGSGTDFTLSGNYDASGLYDPGLLGRTRSDSIFLAFFDGQSARDTVIAIDAKLVGDGSFIGVIRETNMQVEYRKLLTP